jgi:predicted nucleic acid-binding protein
VISRRVFVDTNVWVYTVDRSEGAKQKIARDLLQRSRESDLVVSAQVLGEFFVTVTGKLSRPVPPPEARALVDQMRRLPVVPIDSQLVARAIAHSEVWQLSYWDALIVAAANVAGCTRILSEDMSDGAVYDGLQIENPFNLGGVSEPAGSR